MNGERADHQRHHRVARDAQGQHGDERGLRAGIIGGFGPRHAFNRAVAELRRIARPALLEGVGGKRAQGRTAAGKHAEDGAERGAAQHGGKGATEIIARRPQARDLLCSEGTRFLRLRQIGDDLADAAILLPGHRLGRDQDVVIDR